MKPSKGKVSAKVFDKAFDQGKDVSPCLDLRTAKVRLNKLDSIKTPGRADGLNG